MKGWRQVTILLLFVILAVSVSCNPFGSGEQNGTQQLAEVVRGDLSVTVSGNGNIAVAKEMKLTFGIAGRVDKINVEEGDEVEEGAVLAKLETDDLELALTQARVAYSRAEVAVTQAEVAVTQAEVAVTQAEVALQTAEFNLNQTQKTHTLSDIKAAQANVDTARRELEEALLTLSKYDPGTPGWEENQRIVNLFRLRLNTAEDTLDAMLSGAGTEEVVIKNQQVKAARQSLELSRQSLESNIKSLELAQHSLELSQQSLQQAQKQLGKATMTAPFDGAVASVNIDEQDTVAPGTMIIHLVDPGSMELTVAMDEIDISVVKAGQRALIDIDALPDLPLEGEVSSISLLPAVEGGVVLYSVKIKFDVPEDSGLRNGMSATADITVARRDSVLLIPDRAIRNDSQGSSLVEVMVNGQIQERMVVTGISDGVRTEIIDGLAEGEMVVERRTRSS